MVDESLEDSSVDADEADRSLLNIARAVWHVRWLVLGCLVAGVVLGVWYDSGQARFRTTTTVRWMSPSVSYLYNGYWDVTSKIRAGQLRAIIDGHPQAARISLRTDKDLWIARLEVLHDEPQEGRVVGEEIFQSLRQLDATTAAAASASKSAAAPLHKLRQTLTDLELLLASIPAESPGIQPAVPDDPITRLNQQFTSEAGPRLPLENLPMFPWYRSLQVRASQVLAATAAAGASLPAASQERLTALQQVATEQILECWWSFDVLVSSGPLPGFQVESVWEQPIASRRRQVQAGLLGLWIAGCVVVLLAVPLRWFRVYWRLIVAAETSNRTSIP